VRADRLGEGDFRSANPRFTGEAVATNQAIADAVAEVAALRGVTPARGHATGAGPSGCGPDGPCPVRRAGGRTGQASMTIGMIIGRRRSLPPTQPPTVRRMTCCSS
jgi:hypothetical protein